MSDANNWGSPPHQLQLEPNDIHIWRVSLPIKSIKAITLSRLLTVDEVIRAQRFHFQRDYNCYVVARGILRILLGAYNHIPPEHIRFQYSAHGRPSLILEQNAAMLDFNISHSHEMALMAFTRGPLAVVGVDLEYVRPDIAHEQIAEHFFSTQEVTSLRALPTRLQSIAFFNCWTRKEALIKASGEGLSKSLDQFSMSLTPGEDAKLLSVLGQPEELSKWFVQDLQPGAGYTAAIVARNPVEKIYKWEYPLSYGQSE
jgi:4'-phosphopantetheinyl transferase